MNFLRSFFDSFGSLYFSANVGRPESEEISLNSGDRRMDTSEPGPSAVVSDRIAHKLKGYFELAKEEIDKAVRAEEWGLAEDAIAYYRTANRILTEAKFVRAPSAFPLSEMEKVKTYNQKISKWLEQVSERIQVLEQRARTSLVKIDSVPSQTRNLSPKISVSRKPVPQSSLSTRSIPSTQNQKKLGQNLKPSSQDSFKNHNPKLVEIINTSIIDRSPAVRWDDVAGLERAKQSLLEMVILPAKRRDLFTGLRRPARV